MTPQAKEQEFQIEQFSLQRDVVTVFSSIATDLPLSSCKKVSRILTVSCVEQRTRPTGGSALMPPK